jgi:transposase
MERIEAGAYELYVGIDVGARTLSLAYGKTKQSIGVAETVSQSKVGYGQMVRKLKASGCPPARVRVVLEATSTYWMQAAVALHEAGFAVVVLNPKQAHHYALSEAQQAKTDALDARLLAHLAADKALPSWQPASEIWEHLYQRLVERDQLVERQQMVRNELHALCQRVQPDPAVVARKQATLDFYRQQIAQVDHELRDLLRCSSWAALFRRVSTIPGIGLLGAAWLLVITNGFTTCETAEQLTAYLGLAPYRQDSGRRKAHKPIGRGGHSRARRIIYQGAVSASRFNPPVKALYDRLIQAGKHTKVARCAAARKLVHQVFAIATKGLVFDPSFSSAT